MLTTLLFLSKNNYHYTLVVVAAVAVVVLQLPLIIIMYIYHALVNAQSTHMIHINLNTIFYTRVEHSPTKPIYIKYYTETHTHTHTHTHCTIAGL